jgi:hypothetical protein
MAAEEQYQGLKGTPENVAGTIIATREQFGTNATPSDDDVVTVGAGKMTIRDALKLGILFRNADGSLGENSKPGAVTRTDA